MTQLDTLENLGLGYPAAYVGNSMILHTDCFEWLARIPENSLHAFVTDPPYGVKEYESGQLDKRTDGHGGVWRIPRPLMDISGHPCLALRLSLPRKGKV